MRRWSQGADVGALIRIYANERLTLEGRSPLAAANSPNRRPLTPNSRKINLNQSPISTPYTPYTPTTHTHTLHTDTLTHRHTINQSNQIVSLLLFPLGLTPPGWDAPDESGGSDPRQRSRQRSRQGSRQRSRRIGPAISGGAPVKPAPASGRGTSQLKKNPQTFLFPFSKHLQPPSPLLTPPPPHPPSPPF